MTDPYTAPSGPVPKEPSRLARRGGGPFTPSTRQPVASSSSASRNGTINSYWQNGGQAQRRAPTADMVSPTRTVFASSALLENISAAARSDTNPPPVGATQESQSSEDARMQAKVDFVNNKRDHSDPTFEESPPPPKRARARSISATPVMSAPGIRRGRVPKRYEICTGATQAERRALVQAIRDKWNMPYTEWIPEVSMPHGEPRDWGKPLLTKLRRLAELAPGHGVASAREAMSTAVAERDERGEGTMMLTAEDVGAAIRALSPFRAGDARSPTFAPNTTVEPVTPVLHAEEDSDDETSSVQHQPDTADRAQLVTPRSPGQAASARWAEKQPVRTEPFPEISGAKEKSTVPSSENLEDVCARIDEIYRLKAVEEKAEAKRLVLEDQHQRWKLLLSRGSKAASADLGETIGD